jgi:hypothetical protein
MIFCCIVNEVDLFFSSETKCKLEDCLSLPETDGNRKSLLSQSLQLRSIRKQLKFQETSLREAQKRIKAKENEILDKLKTQDKNKNVQKLAKTKRNKKTDKNDPKQLEEGDN